MIRLRVSHRHPLNIPTAVLIEDTRVNTPNAAGYPSLSAHRTGWGLILLGSEPVQQTSGRAT